MSLRNSQELTNDDKHMSNDNQRPQLNCNDLALLLTVMSLRNSQELTNDDKHMSNDNQRPQLNCNDLALLFNCYVFKELTRTNK